MLGMLLLSAAVASSANVARMARGEAVLVGLYFPLQFHFSDVFS